MRESYESIQRIHLTHSTHIEIYDRYESYQLESPTVIEGDNYVKYILPRRQKGKLSQPTAPDDEKDIVALFSSVTEISISDVVKILHLTRATAGRRLATLIKKKILTRTGKGKAVRYKIRSIGVRNLIIYSLSPSFTAFIRPPTRGEVKIPYLSKWSSDFEGCEIFPDSSTTLG